VVSHPSVNWQEYFYSIRRECPWSWASWSKDLIDISKWCGEIVPLDHYDARIYVVKLNRRRVKKLAKQLDQGVYEWLWSSPGYGPYATPVACLIQQDRNKLNEIRKKSHDIIRSLSDYAK
jgi:hypothetical protein